MRRTGLYLIVFICLLFNINNTAKAEGLLQIGSKGKLVTEIQTYLFQLKYLRVRPTGYYGSQTVEAVKSFQLEHSLLEDGKVGPETYPKLQQAAQNWNKGFEYTVASNDTLPDIAEKFNTPMADIIVKNNLPGAEVSSGKKIFIPTDGYHNTTSRSGRGKIQGLPWSIVNQLWKTGALALFTDVQTGKSFWVKRYGGVLHADSEPLTKKDTRTLLEIYGGHWSWKRRPVVVQYKGLYISASINGMPHGGENIHDNGFQGQFCAHFLGSRVHWSGRVDQSHQKMIEEATNSEQLTIDSGDLKVNSDQLLVAGNQE